MSMVVTLHVYSGRTNPSWVLDDKQAAEFETRLRKLNTETLSKPTGVLGGLGYRGFSVQRTPAAAEGRVFVHEGIADFGSMELNRSGGREIEDFLLSTAPAGTVRGRAQAAVKTQIAKKAAPLRRMAVSPSGCPVCVAADAPAYNPALWNTPAVQPYNNCYNYANDQITNTFAQPGRAHGFILNTMDCPTVQKGATLDGLVACANFSTPLGAGQGWYVALVIWPEEDYHWYRQDNGGCWSHKAGGTAARNTDDSGNQITDPQTCDRGDYTVFCTYMITNSAVVIN